MSLEPSLLIPQTASSMTVEWFADGAGWQGGSDESWATENVQIGLVVLEPTMAGTAIALCLLAFRNPNSSPSSFGSRFHTTFSI
jgi:hypothetical protein